MSVEFVDTNLLIYSYDPSAGERHTRAKAVLAGLWQRGEGALSTQVLQEFYVNATRKIPVPLTPQRASSIIEDYSVWTVFRPEVPTILSAIELSRVHLLSFWDALILVSARETGASVVWSEDLNAGQSYDGVEVRNPFSPTLGK